MPQTKTKTKQELLKILQEQINKIFPVVSSHGGGVSILQADFERVILKIQGNCSGCPLAAITYGVVLNKYIKEALPEIKEIKYI